MNALLAAPDRSTWAGRRDHAILSVALQTGLRVSEIINLRRRDIVTGTGAHIRCDGKGRKQRCTPLRQEITKVLDVWLRERGGMDDDPLFPTMRGTKLSRDALERLVQKHTSVALKRCPQLTGKRVSPHVLRHYLPFRTMSGSEESLRIWIGDSRSRSAKPRTLRDIVSCPVTDYSGRRGVGRQVYSDPALHAVGMSWQVLSPSWQVSLRDKSGWFQHVRDRATMR